MTTTSRMGDSRLERVVGRVAGLTILVVLALKILGRGLTYVPGGALGFIHGVDLIFHEAGHVILGFFGEFVHVLGGSLLQVAIPAVCAIYFFGQRRPAACAVALFWTGESLTDVAIYVADGQRRALPLLSEGMTHDWNYLLGRLGLLGYADGLGRLVFIAGALTMLAALGLLAHDAFRAWTRPSRANDML